MHLRFASTGTAASGLHERARHYDMNERIFGELLDAGVCPIESYSAVGRCFQQSPHGSHHIRDMCSAVPSLQLDTRYAQSRWPPKVKPEESHVTVALAWGGVWNWLARYVYGEGLC